MDQILSLFSNLPPWAWLAMAAAAVIFREQIAALIGKFPLLSKILGGSDGWDTGDVIDLLRIVVIKLEKDPAKSEALAHVIEALKAYIETNKNPAK